MLTVGTAVDLLSQYVGDNKEPKVQIYLACDYFLKCGDPVGSLERVTFTVTTDSTGQGFITLPDRYETIRGAVENPTTTSPCGYPLRLRNDYYEFQPGNLGMLKGSDALRGIIPIQLTQTDTTTYLDALIYGLKALDKRDAEDYAREAELWNLGKASLADEKENQVGPEALGKV